MLSSDELAQFEKLLKPLKEGQERIEKTQQEQGKAIHGQGTAIAQIKTAVEAFAAGQQDVRKQVTTLSGKVATKADVQDIKTDLVKQQRRIENLEENTKTPNPHKN